MATTTIRQTNELNGAQSDFFISGSLPSLGFGSCKKRMGAAGFEPATAWSEAKYSVQTELSALGLFWVANVRFRRTFKTVSLSSL